MSRHRSPIQRPTGTRGETLAGCGVAWVVTTLVTGCASSSPLLVKPPVEHPATWEAAPLERASVQLRLRHDLGDKFAGELEGQARVLTSGRSDGEAIPAGPVDMTFRAHWSDEVLEASPTGPFSIRSCTETGEIRIEGYGKHATSALPRVCSDGGLSVTELNAWPPRPEAAPSDEPVRRWKLDAVAPTDFVNTIPFPVGSIAPGATWEQKEQWTTRAAGEVPQHLSRVVRWTLLGIEHSATGPFARLKCDGDFDTHFTFDAPSGTARGDTKAKLGCAVRLSLTDGATSDFRVDFDSAGKVTSRDAKEEGTLMSTARGHVEGHVARAP